MPIGDGSPTVQPPPGLRQGLFAGTLAVGRAEMADRATGGRTHRQAPALCRSSGSTTVASRTAT